MSDDLEVYLGRDINDVQKELEGKGYTVHVVENGQQAPSTDAKRIVLHRGVRDPSKVSLVFQGNKSAMMQEEIIIGKKTYKHPKLADPQQYMGRNVREAEQELKAQGYTVHLVCVGPRATGCVPLAADDEKRIVLTFDSTDGDKVINIREGVDHGEWMSDHANMQWRP